MTGAETQPKKKKKRRAKRTLRKQLPQYKVLLHNDIVNSALDVVKHVQEIVKLDEPAAMKKVMEAHESDISLLIITHKERAELYCEQFAACRPKKITVTTEPA